MRRIACAFALVAAAQSAHAQNVRVRIAIIGHGAPIAVDSMASEFALAASRGATYHAAKLVMDELKIPVDTRDSLRGMVGVLNVPRMRTFANSRISRFLNCGMGITGANADNWRVYVTAMAFVDPKDSTNTELRVAMVGGARDVAGASTDPVACGSTGVFESLFADRVKARLAALAP